MSAISVSILATISNVTSAQLDASNATIKKAGGTQQALSAYLRTGQKTHATTGALAYVWNGIRELLADGQKSKLQGFSLASKKDSAALNTLRNLGVVSESGSVVIGVENSFKGSKADKEWGEKFPQFLALVQANEAIISAKKATAKKATAPEATAPEATAPEATTEAPKTPGQIDDDTTAHLIARINAGMLSSDNLNALLAVLAPHGVKAAPKKQTVKA